MDSGNLFHVHSRIHDSARHRGAPARYISTIAQDTAAERRRAPDDRRGVFRVVAKHSTAQYIPAQGPWLKAFVAGTALLCIVGHTFRYAVAAAGVTVGFVYFVAYQFRFLEAPELPTDD